jgi:hypothetical protein
MPEEDSNALSVAPDGRPVKDQPAWRRDFPLDWPEDETGRDVSSSRF